MKKKPQIIKAWAITKKGKIVEGWYDQLAIYPTEKKARTRILLDKKTCVEIEIKILLPNPVQP